MPKQSLQMQTLYSYFLLPLNSNSFNYYCRFSADSKSKCIWKCEYALHPKLCFTNNELFL